MFLSLTLISSVTFRLKKRKEQVEELGGAKKVGSSEKRGERVVESQIETKNRFSGKRGLRMGFRYVGV